MKYARFLISGLLIISTLSMNLYASGEGDVQVQKLSKAEFYQKVMDLSKVQSGWKYSGSLPCIVDFYADWCGPCRKASPILEELALKYKGKIVVYKVNTDQEKELSSAFNISGIPAFLWVPKEGKPTMSSGIASSDSETKAMFEKMIKEVLLK